MFVSTSAVPSARFAMVLAAAIVMSMLFVSEAFAAQRVRVRARANNTTTSTITAGSLNIGGTIQVCGGLFCNQNASSTNTAVTGVNSTITSSSTNTVTVIQTSN